MKKRLFLSVTVFVLICGFSLAGGLGPYRQGELLVRFANVGFGLDSPDPAVRQAARQNILDAAGGGTVVRLYERIPGWALVKLPVGQCVESMLVPYASTPGIMFVEPNYRYELCLVPNDTLYDELWGMRNVGQTGGTVGADIDAELAWDIETGDSQIIVAVTDTGVDYTHLDLQGNIWINIAEFNGDPNVDDDGNGYVDDIYGYDFAGAEGEDPDDGDSDPMDTVGHGTHVSGTIGAVGNNSRGVTGVCWDVRLMALKVFADDGGALTSELADAIEYAIDNGARVINASWGGGAFSQLLRDAIADAQSANVIFVASAGNDSVDNELVPHYPSSYNLNNIISVMATTDTDTRASYSNWGRISVDLAAPGGESPLIDPDGQILSTWLGGGYDAIVGTSMSAPHVSGACALLLSYEPTLSYIEVKNQLLDTVDPVAALENLSVTGGRLNIGMAIIDLALDIFPPIPDPAEWAPWGHPKATGIQTIAMEAKEAEDRGEVEYYFECVTDSAFDSGWQSGTLYVATGLAGGTEYTFRVRARDDVNNQTGWSVQSSATTDSGTDTSSPFPDPPVWDAKPQAIRLTPIIITMRAKEASDESGVEYSFYASDINDSSITQSGWQDSPIWRPSGSFFTIGNTYKFRFQVRDKSASHNTTAFSPTASLTLRQGPRTLAVPSHYSTIQAAIDDANVGDVVVISPGEYIGSGNVNLIMKPGITVRSIDPNDPDIVTSTIIDCRGRTRGFQFISGEDTNSIVAGLTIRDGNALGPTGTPGGPGIPGDPNNPPTPAGPGGDGQGGGMVCLGSSPTILNCILEGCAATGGDGGDPNGGPGGAAGHGYGGGIYCDFASSPIIRGCEFIGCSASAGNPTDGISFGQSFGGGIYLAHGSTALIEGCTISGCIAASPRGGTERGGGIYHGLAGVAVSIVDTKVIGSNIAGDEGGGIYFALGGSGTVLTNCEISFNTAGNDGGGIYYRDGHTLFIQNSRISNNLCNSRGGGIFAGDISHPAATTVNISDSLLTNNAAEFGGGIYMDETDFDLVGSDVSNNSAEEGAGINGAFCDVNMVDSTISDNEAVTGAGIGGGMALWDTTGRIINCTVINNAATGAAGTAGIGGAMYLSGFDNTPKRFVNCLITQNKATKEGAGMFCHMGVWADVNNCTIADNSVVSDSGSGGGISCAEFAAYVQLRNSIVYNNSAPEGPQIAVGRVTGSVFDPFALVDVEYSDVQGGEDDVFIEDPAYNAVYFLAGNWDEENPFVSIGVDNPVYYLRHIAAGQTSDSVLIDSGMGDADDLANLVGFDLTTRTDGVKDTGTVDIGYHYPAVSIPEEYHLLTIRVEYDPDYDADGILKAEGFGFESFIARNEPNTMMIRRGVEVKLTAVPDDEFEVSQWTGADEVPNTADPCNIVTMNADKEVTVSFQPDGQFYLYTDVSTNNGHIDYINGGGQRLEHPGRTSHQSGEVVQLFAVPNNPLMEVAHWTGADDEETVGLENTATMNSNRNVVVEIVAPNILHVPGEYTNIQTAIEDAEDGDIIIVAPGTYRRFIDYGTPYELTGKQITLTGSDPEDPCTVAATILNTGIWILDVGRTCRIEGLTFRDINYFWYRPGFDGGTQENPGPDGENGFPSAGSALILHESYFAGGFVNTIWPRTPQPGSSPDVRNCVFIDCSTTGRDGGAGAVVDGIAGDGGWGGWAHGGAVSLGADSNPRFTNCQFIDCFARGGNGGNGSLGGRGGLWDLTDLGEFGWTFGPYEEFFKYSGFGGAVFVDVNSSPEFIDCNFVNCQVYGGASGMGNLDWPDQHWRINRFGGAVYCADDSTATFTRCNFINNIADINGPDTWNWQSWHSSAEEPASSDDDFLSYGGAVAFEDSANVTFIQCDFNDNTATVGGAVHWTWADPHFDDCNFVDNSAFHGGGILCVGGSGLIDNCRFTGNTATITSAQGGAIASLGANTDILNSELIGNHANGSGGGIYISNKDIDGDEITGFNVVTVSNCLIAENTSGLSGAGVSSNWQSYADIEFCTIANNAVLTSGYGGGLYSSNGNYAVVRDSILWGNTAANGRQIAIRPSIRPAGVAVSYTDIRGGNTFLQPPATGGNIWVDQDCLFEPGPGNIGADEDDDPLFVSGILGDYFLSQKAVKGQNKDSPCVDAGSAPASSLGIDNRTTRTDLLPDRGDVDMGYHYRRDMAAARCAVCDLVFDGIIDMADMAAFTDFWVSDDCSEDNGWCDGADFNSDGHVDFKDEALLVSCLSEEDTQPPLPNPSKWRIVPISASTHSIFMGAEPAYDAWGTDVEYFFECSDANHDSNWRSDPNYTSSGLVSGRQYSYRVKARDEWGNETQFSVYGSAVVSEDTTPPTPNPMTWALEPEPFAEGAIMMTASTATDESGVEYGFWNLDTGNIVWQDDPTFIDQGLEPETEYTYQTAARDKSSNQNTTGWSVPASATTNGEIDTEPPITDVYANIYKAAFAVPPEEVTEDDGYHHQMTAVVATDQTPPVQYRFICYDVSGFSSGWQTDPFYDVLVSSLQSKSYFKWQVVTRDSVVPTPNVGDRSDYWNCRGQSYPYP